ncbi:MAG: RsmG family class I SAM-dependent methyltransferase [Desulfomonilia bacterium]|jgi:16S rRNA (guanine(527)-N(7))-methyltransferase RsmG
MIDDNLITWIHELRRFNGKLHLMGPAMLDGIEQELEVMLPLLMRIHEPVLADLGSGSGLPSIPYKILHPDSHLYLIERSVKKCTFLRHVIEMLALEGIEIISRDPLHEDIGRFDAVLARSFSPLSTLTDVCLKILKPNGRLYYLFTGSTPELAQDFQPDEVISETCAGFSLNLVIFNRLP